MIFAGERPVHQLADGDGVVDVVQDDDQRYLRRAGLPVDLIGQVGQVQLQVLTRRNKEPKTYK